MSSKTSNNEYLQVVFLIDENSTNINDGIKGKDASSSVCLCVLRILSYFNELRGGNSFTLRWGFKFYNSRSLNQRYQRHNFKEFCVSEFENFEKDVCERFEEEARSQEQEQSTDGMFHTDDEFASNTTTTRLTASKSLTCALTDLVHDFQWEINDLNSPLRTTRRSNPLQHNSRRTHNVVFLLTKCPRNFNSLREFCGLKIQDLNSLRNAIMSAALLKEFNEVYKINLNWINTDRESEIEDQDVVDMMTEFLQMFSGTLIPLQSLVFNQRYPSPPPEASVTDTSNYFKQCSLVIPVVSVLSHYMGKLKCTGAIGQSCIMSAIQLQSTEGGTVPDSDLWIGWLCSPGAKPVVHCTLQLSSMLSSHCSTSDKTKDSSSATTSISNPSLVIQQSSTGNHVSYKISTSASDIPSIDKENDTTQKKCPNVFWIKGSVRRDKICPSWFHITKVYTCVAMVTEKENETNSSGLSGWFQRLLLTLAKQNLSLVIELADPESGIPITSVLQPLTSICGVLSIVNSNKLLTLEKLLLWHQRSSSRRTIYGSEQRSVEGLHAPEITDGGAVTARNLTSSEVHCPLIMSSSGACSSETFSTQDLNSWSLGLACLEQGADVTQASSKCSDNRSSHESSLIQKLKELYSKKRSKKSKLEDKKTKLKHMEKRKKEKKMHEQVKKKLQKEELLSSGSNTAKEDVLQPVVSSSNFPSSSDTQKDDNDASSEEKKKEMTILLESLELDVEQDLRNFLKDAYYQAVAHMEGLTKFIEKCIAVIDFYLRKAVTCTQKMTVQGLLADCLLLSNLSIRDKYEGLKTPDCKQNKLTEYQLQVLLRLEIMLCSGGENNSLIDEVVVMLRSISFIKDPGFLRDFLKEVILTRYAQHIPKFLCEIYEGLMQDLPPELQSPSNQNSEDEESPLKRSQISSVVRPESDQPRSEISRPLTRHRSIADMGGRRREIVIPPKAKSKTRTGKREHDNNTCLSTKEKSDHHKGKSQKTPVKKVRRNLFTDEEEETPGMAGNSRSKSKLKVPSIFGKEDRSGHHRNKESRRHSVAHSKIVRETPGRKQIHNALWQKQHRARKRTVTATDLNVVKESPLKEILAANLPRRSPRHPVSTFQRSQSFYGGNPRSCPLVRTRSSSSIRSGSPIKKLDLNENTDASNLATDAMETSTTPVKDTIKESPVRFSPRRRKRFALHTLLAKTTTRTERDFSSNSKILTPKSKGEAPVRSSPRLLKKRSFSCIGFSSSVFNYSKSGNSSDGSRISTPSKNKVLTPTRSSPRFKKSASDSTGMARNRDGPPCSEQNRWNPERRKKLQTPPYSGLPDINPAESSSGNLSKRTRTESIDHLMDSNKSTKLSENENDSEDSEVILNLDKQPILVQTEPLYCAKGSEDQCSSRTFGVRDTHEANFTGRKRVLVLSSGVEQREDAGDEPSVDLVDSSMKNDTSNNQNARILRSIQRRTSFEHQCEAIGSSPQSRNKVAECNLERNGGRSPREILSRKRLSFSPSRNMGKIEDPSCASVDGCVDNDDKNKNKAKLQVDEAVMNKDNDDGRGVNTRTDDAENLVDDTLKAATPLRRSPRKHLTKNSPVCGSQRLLTPKPAVATPPAKKRRKTRSHTEQETKRSSPLNQILKHRKRNRTMSLKSPKSKAHSEVGTDIVTHKGPRDVISEGQADCFAQLAMELLDDCSKSSEDMVYDWFRHIDIEPTAMSGVSEINSTQRTTGQKDFGFDDDEVFQNPPTLRSGKMPYKPATPISAKSIKMLRESPLLVNSSSISVPPGSLSKKWSDSSPSGRERLKRRKRSEAFGGNSSELDTSVSDEGENMTERSCERNPTRSRKRIKLSSN